MVEYCEGSIVKKGQFVDFETGDYEEAIVSNTYLCLKDFDYVEQGKKCFMEYYKTVESDIDIQETTDFSSLWEIDFINYLIKNGFLKKVDHVRVFLGSNYFLDEQTWQKEFHFK